MTEQASRKCRRMVLVRKKIVFKHDSALGNEPAHKLFEAVKVERVHGESGTPAAAYSDYRISVDSEGLNGVSVDEMM